MKNWIVILFFLSGNLALATEEQAESLASKRVLMSEAHVLKGNRGRVHILIHNDGHSNGRGMVLELRPDCARNRKPRPWKELELRDLEAQCYLDLKTLKFDVAGETVSIEGCEMDYELYEKNQQKDPPVTAATCDFKVRKTFKLDTAVFCSNRR